MPLPNFKKSHADYLLDNFDPNRDYIGESAIEQIKPNSRLPNINSINKPANDQQGYLADMVDKFQEGFYNASGSTMTGLRGLLTDDRERWDIEQAQYDAAARQQDTLSDAQKQADAKLGFDFDEGDELNTRNVPGLIASGLGSFGPSMLAGGIPGMALKAGAKALGAGGALQKGAQALGYGAGGAAMIGGSTKNTVEEELSKMTPEQIHALDGYKEYLDTLPPEEARKQFEYDRSQEALGQGALLGGASMALFGPIMEKVMMGKFGKGPASNILSGIVSEGTQEAFEEGGETRITNPLLGRPDWENVPESAGLGAIGGGASGGIVGGLGSMFGKRPVEDTSNDNNVENNQTRADTELPDPRSTSVPQNDYGSPDDAGGSGYENVGFDRPRAEGPITKAGDIVTNQQGTGDAFLDQLAKEGKEATEILDQYDSDNEARKAIEQRNKELHERELEKGLHEDPNFYQDADGLWHDRRLEQPVETINQKQSVAQRQRELAQRRSRKPNQTDPNRDLIEQEKEDLQADQLQQDEQDYEQQTQTQTEKEAETKETGTETRQQAGTDEAGNNEDALNMSYFQARNRAEDLGLETKGNKIDLINRINEYERTHKKTSHQAQTDNESINASLPEDTKTDSENPVKSIPFDSNNEQEQAKKESPVSDNNDLDIIDNAISKASDIDKLMLNKIKSDIEKGGNLEDLVKDDIDLSKSLLGYQYDKNDAYFSSGPNAKRAADKKRGEWEAVQINDNEWAIKPVKKKTFTEQNGSSGSRALDDFLDGKRDDVPTIEEVEQETSYKLTAKKFTTPNGQERISITGNTRELKDEIKSIKGARWNKSFKAWTFPASKQDEVNQKLGKYLGNEQQQEEKPKAEPKTKKAIIPADEWENDLFKARDYAKRLYENGDLTKAQMDNMNWSNADDITEQVKSIMSGEKQLTKADEDHLFGKDRGFEPEPQSLDDYVDDFVSDKQSFLQNSYKSTLNNPIGPSYLTNFGNSKKEVINNLVKNYAGKVTKINGERVLKTNNNLSLTEQDITKTGMNFAEFLQKTYEKPTKFSEETQKQEDDDRKLRIQNDLRKKQKSDLAKIMAKKSDDEIIEEKRNSDKFHAKPTDPDYKQLEITTDIKEALDNEYKKRFGEQNEQQATQEAQPEDSTTTGKGDIWSKKDNPFLGTEYNEEGKFYGTEFTWTNSFGEELEGFVTDTMNNGELLQTKVWPKGNKPKDQNDYWNQRIKSDEINVTKLKTNQGTADENKNNKNKDIDKPKKRNDKKDTGTNQANDKQGIIGVNKNGHNVGIDQYGVRYYIESGIKISQPVNIIPGSREVTHAGTLELYQTGKKEFLTASEILAYDRKYKENSETENPIIETKPENEYDKTEENLPQGKSKEQIAAQNQFDKDLAAMGDFLLSMNSMKVVPDEHRETFTRLLTNLMGSAFKLGYIKFKENAKHVIDTVTEKFGKDAASNFDEDSLQGSYIAMSSGKKGITPKKEVINTTLDDILKGEQNVTDNGISTNGNGTLGGVSSEALGETETDERNAPGNTESSEKGKGKSGKPDAKGAKTGRSGRNGATRTDTAKTRVEQDKKTINQPNTNFEITDEVELGSGTAGVKFKDNIAAIETLQKIEAEGRQATAEEQKILARYVGWGGLSNAFRNALNGNIAKGWESKVEQLENLLTTKELDAARASTPNAHYTPQTVVEFMWKAVNRLGYSGGNVLEPSMGTGNFLGLMPKGNRSFVTGIELDSITSRIAAKLYPQSNVIGMDFGSVPLPMNKFDLVIGNPPFGNVKMDMKYQPQYNKNSIHNQFFLSSIDATRPNGIVAMVVSHYFMDAKKNSVRAEIAKKAELVGAIRLPGTAFKGNANTEVITDIIFLRKRQNEVKNLDLNTDNWLESNQSSFDPEINVNQYFVNNPNMVIGKMDNSGTMNQENSLGIQFSGDLNAELNKLLSALPEVSPLKNKYWLENSQTFHQSFIDAMNIEQQNNEVGDIISHGDGSYSKVVYAEDEDGTSMLRSVPVNENLPLSGDFKLDTNGRWFLMVPKLDKNGNKVKIGSNIVYERKTYNSVSDIDKQLYGKARFEKLKQLLVIRDLVKEQIKLESNDDQNIEKNRKKLKRAYDAFVKKHGLINESKNSRLIADMPDEALLMSLESDFRPAITAIRAKRLGIKPRPAQATPSDIFQKRIILNEGEVKTADSLEDALAISMAETGGINIDRISQLTNSDDVSEQLIKKGLAFIDPEKDGILVSKNEYLSGNVKRKLNAALQASLTNNIEALRKVQPKPWKSDQINPVIGSAWIPEDVYSGFLSHLIQEPSNIRFSKNTNTFDVEGNSDNALATSKWGTDDFPAPRLLSAILNNSKIVVGHRDQDGKFILDETRTQEAKSKADDIKLEFDEWIFKEQSQRERLTELFNDLFNVRVNRQYDGSHMTYPGKVPDEIIKMRRGQNNAIWRGITDQTVLYDHAVGAGKTFVGIARALERKRMGLANKPLIVVPNHIVTAWGRDIYNLYPGAKALIPTKADLDKKNRRRFFAKIATNDWDIIVIPHSFMQFMELSTETQQQFLREEIAIAESGLREAQQAADESGNRSWGKPLSVKQAENLIRRLTTKLHRLLNGGTNSDRLLNFEQLGIDDLTIDESHEFKNLQYTSSLQGVRGMGSTDGSQKAMDLYFKIKHLYREGNGIAFLTGTPISNSAVEMYNIMRYLAPDTLREMGLDHFDAFRSQFVSIDTKYEPTESGHGLKRVDRLGRQWSNMRGLMDAYYSFADVVTNDDIKAWYREDNPGKEYPLPKVKGGYRKAIDVEPTPSQIEAIEANVSGFESLQYISDYVERNKQRLRLMDAARKISISTKALDPNNQDEPGGKLDVVADNVKRIYDDWTKDRGTQLIFLDRGIPSTSEDRATVKKYDKLVADLKKYADKGDEAGYMRTSDKLDSYNESEIEAMRSAANGGWNAYQHIKDNLVNQGIPENEIAFIHSYNTPDKKQELFNAVNDGEIRVLIGSSPKMGAGTNVQERLVALHHVDATWKPSDIEQREGRIIRQGNALYDKYPDFEVEINAYVTKRTVDQKFWSLNATKLAMVNGIRHYDGQFEMEFDDQDSLSMAEISAIASDNPLLLKRFELEGDIEQLARKKRAWRRSVQSAEDEYSRAKRILDEKNVMLKKAQKYTDTLNQIKSNKDKDVRKITIDGETFNTKSKANFAIDSNKEKGKRFNVNGNVVSKTKAMEQIDSVFGDVDEFRVEYNGKSYIKRSEYLKAVNRDIDLNIDDTAEIGTYYGARIVLDKLSRHVEAAVIIDDGTLNKDAVTSAEYIRTNAHLNEYVNAAIKAVLRKIENKLGYPSSRLERTQEKITNAENNFDIYKNEAKKPFKDEAELQQKTEELRQLEIELSEGSRNETDTAETKETEDGKVKILESSGYYANLDNGGVPNEISNSERGNSYQVQSPKGSGVIQPTSGVSVPSANEITDNFRIRVKQVPTGQFKTGSDIADTPAKAARIVKDAIGNHAQESMVALVLDKNSKVVNFIKHTKGGKAESSVFAGDLVGAIINTDNADSVILSHNHPSGTTSASTADIHITDKIAKLLGGTSVTYQGHIIVNPRSNEYHDVDNNITDDIPMSGTNRKSIDITERVIEYYGVNQSDAIGSTRDAIAATKRMTAKNGVLLLNNQHAIIGAVELSPSEMKSLKGNNGKALDRLFKAIDTTNAAAVIIKTTTDKSGTAAENLAKEIATKDGTKNLVKFLNAHGDVRLLDAINNGRAVAGTTDESILKENGTYFSLRNEKKSIPLSDNHINAIIKRIAPNLKKGFRGQFDVAVVSFSDFPEAVRNKYKQYESKDVYGVFHNGKIYLNKDNMTSERIVEEVLFHEATHGGIRDLFKDTGVKRSLRQLYMAIGRARGFNKIADELGIDLTGYRKQLNDEKGLTYEQKIEIMMDEMLAHISQQRGLKSKVRELIGLVKTFLRKYGWIKLADTFTENDLSYIAKLAREKGLKKPSGLGTRLMVSWKNNIEDINYNNVVNITNQKYRNAYTFDEAKKAAKYFQGKLLINNATRNTAKVSRNNLDKMLNSKAVHKSESPQEHSYAVANLDKLFKDARLGWSKTDRDADNNIKAIHRMFVPMNYKGEIRLVKLTVKEFNIADQDNALYSVESINVEKINPVPEMVDADRENSRLLTGPTGYIYSLVGIIQNINTNKDIKQTDTPEFKKWFGDSKVVDESGNPLVVYHGTTQDISKSNGNIFWASVTTDLANEYAGEGNIMPVFINMKDSVKFRHAEQEKNIQEFLNDALSQSWKNIDEKEFYRLESELVKRYGDKKQPIFKYWLNDPQVQEYLELLGFDGIEVHEKSDMKNKTIGVFNPNQIKSAIGNNGNFDPDNDDIRFSLRPRTGIMSKIGGDKKTIPQKISETFNKIKGTIRQGLVDRYDALLNLDIEVYGEDVIEDFTEKSSWVAAKMSNTAEGVVHHILDYGRVKMDDDGAVDSIPETTSFIESLSKLKNRDTIDKFFAWVAIERSKQITEKSNIAEMKADAYENEIMRLDEIISEEMDTLTAQEYKDLMSERSFLKKELRKERDLASIKERLFDDADIAEGEQYYEENREVFDEVYREFNSHQKDILGIAVQSGILNEEMAEQYKNEFYIPFYRVMEDDKAVQPFEIDKLSKQYFSKRLKGGDKNLGDLLENTLTNWTHLISASLKNKAAAKAIETAEDPSVEIATETSEAARNKKNSIYILRDGAKVWYNIDDPLVFRALTAMQDTGMNNGIMKLMRAFKRMFTSFVTASPQFITANLIRDSIQASALANMRLNPVANAIEGIYNFSDKNRVKHRLVAGGGAFSFGHIYADDPDLIKATISRELGINNLITDPLSAKNTLLKLWDKYQSASNRAENANRVAVYNKAIKDGKSHLKASFEARDLMDFSSRGDWVTVRILTDVVPFLNARIQGLDKLYRSGVKPTINVAKQLFGMGRASNSDKMAANRFNIVLGAVSLIGMALYMSQKDDEDWRDREDWDRDTYFWIKVGDTAITIPKPFEIGALATLSERLLEQIVDDKATGKLFAERIGHMLTQTFAFNPIPQMIKPAIDVYSNKDSFTGRDIETMGMKNVSPSLRKRDNTNIASEYLSKGMETVLPDDSTLTLSPVQIDYLIQQYFGWVGATANGLIDEVFNPNVKPERKIVEMQPIKRFYKELPTQYTRYSTEFYKDLRKSRQVYNDIKHYIKLGNIDEAKNIARENITLLQKRKFLNKVQRISSSINKRINIINNNNGMSAKDKRREIDLLKALKKRLFKSIQNKQDKAA